MKFSKSKIFLFCLIDFIVGVGIASFLPPEYLINDLYWFVVCLFFGFLVIVFWRKLNIRLIGFLALFLFLGIWRYSFGLAVSSADDISYYNGQEINFTGNIISEPDIRSANQKLKIGNIKLRDKSSDIKGIVLLTANRYPEYDYGDQLLIKCKLKAPEKFNDFAYDRYLARYNIYSVCYYPKINKLSSDNGNKLLATIYDFKNIVRNKINRNLAEPQSSLAGGILLGDMRNADENLKLAFSRSGLSHLTAVSGMNVSILALVSISILLFVGMKRRYAFYIATLFLVVFIILVGMPASAMRAGIMGFLALLALNIGRLNRITNVLFLTAAVLLFFNPKLLRDDIGFQLSFLAVLGIIYIYPLFNIFSNKMKTAWLKGIFDILAITLSAQIFTLPIIAYNFSIISLVAPLSNLLVLWCIALLTIGLMIALFLSFLLPVLAWWLFLPFDLLLRYVVKVGEMSAAWPLAFLEIDHLWPGWLFVYYFIAGSTVAYFTKKNKIQDNLIYF